MRIELSDHQRYAVEKEIKAGTFTGCIVKHAHIHKAITFTLVVNDVQFHRVNYGAGVVKLLPNKNVCAHCEGKGGIK